jgi:nucleoside-diphosphate kinase
MAATEERYAFQVTWFDPQADMIRPYLLTFYPRDNSIEMYDPKNKRAFLKRTEYCELRLADIYVGGFATVHARQLEIVDYADSYTRRTLEARKARTLGIIKPDGYNNIGNILTAINEAGLVLGRCRMVKMTAEQADFFCSKADAPGDHRQHAAHLASDIVVAMELVGDDAVNTWLGLMGPDDPQEAKSQAPGSIRGAIGQDVVRNAVHGSSDPGAAAREIDFFFLDKTQKWPTTALFNNCTLCIIRPHAVRDAGAIINRILSEGFEISAMRLWHMDKVTAEEFLDVYKGVLPEYPEMVHQLVVGPCMVLEVRQEDAVNSFRKLVGPHDPEVAKHLRPDTLRSKFGVDRVRNACHCTDLPEDGLLEVEYFFNILYNR